MSRKQLIEDLRSLLTSYYDKDRITITHERDEDSGEKVFLISINRGIFFRVSSSEMKTNCASTEIFGFAFYSRMCVNGKRALKLIMDYYLTLIKTNFYIFSDSERNNKIYSYIDEFYGNKKNFTILENPTTDKLSKIKTVIYSKSI